MPRRSGFGLVETKRFVRLITHFARGRVALFSVLTTREDPHERLAVTTELPNEPEHVTVRLRVGVLIRLLELPKAPLQLRAAVERPAFPETIGTWAEASLGRYLPLAVTSQALLRAGA
jgi:hypothetical protein